jgi:hypothetical protein
MRAHTLSDDVQEIAYAAGIQMEMRERGRAGDDLHTYWFISSQMKSSINDKILFTERALIIFPAQEIG